MLRWLNNKHHRRYLFVLSAAILVTLFLVLPTYAVGEWSPDGFYNTLMRWASDIFLGFGKFFIGSAIFFLKFFIALAQYNNYLDVPTVQIGWIMVRDVANMFFVVALLVIAFGTILGLEQYQWNKTLVKLILAAVFINFSNLICGIFIDIAHVFTITFINAIAGAAGGNLINMFKLTEIYKMVTGGATPDPNSNFPREVLMGSFAAFIFSLMVALIMGFYALIMLFRVVALWVLIIMSPLAFIFQVLPETESKGKEWWKQFSNYVLVAPVAVFFMWLAFATLGTGDVVTTLDLKLGQNELADVVASQATNKVEGQAEYSGPNALSLNAVTTWENLASFLIPLVLLYVGIQKIQELSVAGGGMLSGALDTVKKVATIASGVAAARWIGGKATDSGKTVLGGAGLGLAKGAGYVIGTERIGNFFKRQVQGFHSWRTDSGLRPVEKEIDEVIPVMEKFIDENGKEQERFKRNKETGEIEMMNTGRKRKTWATEEFFNPETGKVEERFKLEKVKPKFAPLQSLFFMGAARDVASRKKLEKTENFAKNRAELLDKMTSGKPNALLMGESEDIDALDRIEQGLVKGMSMRASAKTEEFHALGEAMALQAPRYKVEKGGKMVEEGRTVAEQLAKHKVAAATNKALVESIESGAKQRFIEGKFTFGPFDPGRFDTKTGLWSQGQDLLGKESELEMAKKASEDYVHKVHESHLGHELSHAAEKIKHVIEEWRKESLEKGVVDKKRLQELLSELGRDNPYVKSLVEASRFAEVTSIKGQSETKAKDAAEDAVRNVPRGGELPSTVVSSALQQTESDFKQYERQDASLASVMRIFTAVKKRSDGEELDLEDRRAVMGSWMRVDNESWNDDALEAMMKLIEAKDGGQLSDQSQIVAAKDIESFLKRGGWEFQKVVARDENGNEKLDKNGNKVMKWGIKGGYDREYSAAMQLMASTGGDIEATLAHLAVSREQDTRRSRGESGENLDYWKIASDLKVDKTLETAYTDSQDYLQVAAKDFKKNAIDNGHYESGLNMEYDPVKRMYRANTRHEAESGMVTEMGKRTINELLRSQAHAWGTTDMNNGLLQKVSETMFRAHTMNVHEDYEIKGMTPRTLMKLFGYHESETQIRKDGEYAQLGGSRMINEFGDSQKGKEEMSRHVVMDFLLPAIKGNAESFSYMMMRLFGSKRENLAKGQLKIELENGKKIEGVDELVKIATSYGVAGEELANLQKIADQWSKGNVIASESRQNNKPDAKKNEAETK